MDILSYSSFFFVGIAGTGMSAIAQYLQASGKNVSGSDRQFSSDNKITIQQQFESMGIVCCKQDTSGITENIDVVVVSTAIEETNIEYQKAIELSIPIIKRSELLAAISKSMKTIAVGGTAGKSTTTAMIFHILQTCGKSPSLITGAALTELQSATNPGNAHKGTGQWLVIEADESDGSIVNYTPTISLILNIDRDHKEYSELMQLFSTFKLNTQQHCIVNLDCPRASTLSSQSNYDFSVNTQAPIYATDWQQTDFSIEFLVNSIPCNLQLIGKHNMANAVAAIAASSAVGIPLQESCKALATFKGIYRRAQLVGKTRDKIYVIDDFAHNPAEVRAAIEACQRITPNVVAWFQPHGFGPLAFMYKDLAAYTAQVLRPDDVFIISDVYYAGGTVARSVSPQQVVDAMPQSKAYYIPTKDDFVQQLPRFVKPNTAILIMGARDPFLSDFAQHVLHSVEQKL